MNQMLRTYWVSVVCLILAGYYGYHAFGGAHGLNAQARIQGHIRNLQREFDRLNAKRGQWERQLSLIYDESIDPDMLDQLARELLNYGGEKELIVKLPSEP